MFDDNIGWQDRVQTSLEAREIKSFPEGKRDDLTERVYTGVGTSGDTDADGLAEQAEQCCFNRALHGWGIVLNLPAVVVCPVVFESEFELQEC